MISEANVIAVKKAAANDARSKNMGESILKDAPANVGALPKTPIPLKVHFIKSSCFRVVHASGAWYGGDGQGNLHLTIFNERTAIPRMTVVNLDEQGQVLGEDLSQRLSKEGVIRELEVDIVFSIPSAVQFYRTLGENLKALKAI